VAENPSKTAGVEAGGLGDTYNCSGDDGPALCRDSKDDGIKGFYSSRCV